MKILEGRIDLLATEVLGYELQPFHIEILKFAMNIKKEKGEGLLLAPRGFGKSTIGTVTLSVFLILLNPNIRILIASSTASKAESFLREIKAHFEQNQKVRDLFGEQFNPQSWKSAEIFVLPREKIAKEATLSAHGWSGAVVSKHYDVHLVDDLVNEDNARTKGQREKLADWFYVSLGPTLEPDGFRLMIGTRYHPDDLYGRLLEQTKQPTESWADETEEVKPIRVLKLQAIKTNGSSLWEAKFPIVKLRDKERKMGRIRFASQFQNETELMKGKIIREEDIQYFRRDEVDIKSLRIFQGVDLAVGRKASNDFFALVTKGYDSENRAYTLDCVHGRYSFKEQMILVLWKAGKTTQEIAHILRIPTLTISEINGLFRGQDKSVKRQYRNVLRIGIEAIAYQRVLPDTLLELSSDVPIIKVDQNTDKETRIQQYSPRFENHMEYLPADNSCDRLKEEMLLFPDSEHDDLLDAHEIANRMAASIIDMDATEEEDIEVRVIGGRSSDNQSGRNALDVVNSFRGY